MERRRAIAWAGSIALTASAGALVVGSLFGAFGVGTHVFGPPPAPVTTPGPQAEGNKPRPTPGGGETWPAAGGPAMGSNPPSPTGGGGESSSASVPMSPVPATTNLSGAAVPPRDHSSPVTPTVAPGTPVPNPAELPPAAGAVPVAAPPKPATGAVWRWITAAVFPELRGILLGRGRRGAEPAHRGIAQPAVDAGASGPSSAQNTAPGRSPERDPKTAAGNHPVSGHDD